MSYKLELLKIFYKEKSSLTKDYSYRKLSIPKTRLPSISKTMKIDSLSLWFKFNLNGRMIKILQQIKNIRP